MMIVTTLRRCADDSLCKCCNCELHCEKNCVGVLKNAAAYLIENQQRHIEALMKANESLKDAIAQRDKQIEDMNQGMAQMAKAGAVKEENNGTADK